MVEANSSGWAKSCHAGSAVAAVVQVRKPATQRKVLTRIHVFCDLVASSLRRPDPDARGSRDDTGSLAVWVMRPPYPVAGVLSEFDVFGCHGSYARF
jgi:hypothetical protein